MNGGLDAAPAGDEGVGLAIIFDHATGFDVVVLVFGAEGECDFRSGKRRGGEEGRSRGWPDHLKKKKKISIDPARERKDNQSPRHPKIETVVQLGTTRQQFQNVATVRSRQPYHRAHSYTRIMCSR